MELEAQDGGRDVESDGDEDGDGDGLVASAMVKNIRGAVTIRTGPNCGRPTR